MNTIKTAVEDVVVALLNTLREIVTPIFNKYAAYFKYIDYFIYGSYLVLLLGFYNTVPEYIPLLRNTLLYSAVFILIIRFNHISWSNPKFALLGGSNFSDFDRRLIMYTCFFILVTHIVSETVINYTRTRISDKIIQPVRGGVFNPVFNYVTGRDE
jgi:hypothetical protein